LSEFEQLYREVILDHYKSPRNHGLLDPADAHAEGQNPLCGDEITISLRLGEDDVIEEIGFDGRGCAISQASMSMLGDLVKGRTAADVAGMPKEELLDELGIPLTPVRLKCAILGLGVLKYLFDLGGEQFRQFSGFICRNRRLNCLFCDFFSLYLSGLDTLESGIL